MSGSLWVSDGGQAWQWAGPGALSDEQHQGLLIWCELRPWHSLTKEDRFAVIKHICSPWGRRRAVGVPHPLRGRGPEDALRWVDRLIVSVFRWGEQGFHGEMAGRSTGPPWRVHNWCVRISLMMSRCDTALSSLPDVYHVVFLSSRINTDNPHSISPVLILFPHCVCAHIKARDGCKLPSEQSLRLRVCDCWASFISLINGPVVVLCCSTGLFRIEESRAVLRVWLLASAFCRWPLTDPPLCWCWGCGACVARQPCRGRAASGWMNGGCGRQKKPQCA